VSCIKIVVFAYKDLG